MTQEELKEILDKHTKWLNGEDGGKRADLSNANLSYINLSHVNLRCANLFRINLSGSSLHGADLSRARLAEANLNGADLMDANLRCTNLSHANLSSADLRYTSLVGTDLAHANLSCANLNYANLLDASLWCTNLDGAVYTGTVLNLQCSKEGSFIAWKKLADDAIAKLLIPEDAKRSSATSRKCRASKAEVLAIYGEDGIEISEGRSRIDNKFIYRVGETVYPDSWDEDRWNECSNGIHFFMTRNEAEGY